MTDALAICVILSAVALVYVFWLPDRIHLGAEKTRASYLRERKDAVYENLRDLNFEYKAGKVPEIDYVSMKTSLEDEAATLLAEISRLEAGAALRKAKS
jgi:cell division protein FtsL